MKGIGGNVTACIQKKETGEKSSIGNRKSIWKDVMVLNGWLDLSSGDSAHTSFNAKIQESTHIFICDYQDLEAVGVTSENARAVIKNKVYEVLMIDNPMEMDEQLEIYLKFIGGQNAS